jgi:outer membrane lipoprotein-sorting protein
MKQLRAIAAAALILSAVAAAAGRAPEDPTPALPKSFVKDGKLDIDAAVKHFENMYRSDSSVSTAEIVITKPRRTRTMRMKIWTKGEEKALIVVTAPARQNGTASLRIDKNLWNYDPRIRRTIRIPPSMMMGSWMGSDFTNDDLVKESSYRTDYTYSAAGRSQNPKGWLIKFVAKPNTVGLWKRFEVVLTEDGTLPLLGRYYDRKDRLSRTIRWSEVKEFDGRQLPAKMTLVPADDDKKGHRTEMVYHEIEFDLDMPDSMFSLSELERTR